MEYCVKLSIFEGPMDLLLHLIEKQELDIYNIPIATITEQYLAYLKEAKELDIEFASEFLVMAATLLSIKAKMLFPKPQKEVSENYEEDPRKELMEHLLLYKKIKEATLILKDLEKNQRAKVCRPLDKDKFAAKLFTNIDIPGLTVDGLLAAVEQLIKENKKEFIQFVVKNKYYINEQIDVILSKTRQYNRFLFRELFGEKMNLLEVLVTFLALLELVKMQKIKVIQESPFSQITIVKI
ncbi:MAG: segregation/condensation protein A [Bacillota bacterium]